ncbi:uncharacterized protein BDV17DRAFT_265239 [Aspergillus undulatus]|uniref:uncharacterized protein n=1 Tax=Aspergillus undulatus TaxID=1810928 RepID=UPI003CCCB53B
MTRSLISARGTCLRRRKKYTITCYAILGANTGIQADPNMFKARLMDAVGDAYGSREWLFILLVRVESNPQNRPFALISPT